jgi:hypothetical protein
MTSKPAKMSAACPQAPLRACKTASFSQSAAAGWCRVYLVTVADDGRVTATFSYTYKYALWSQSWGPIGASNSPRCGSNTLGQHFENLFHRPADHAAAPG